MHRIVEKRLKVFACPVLRRELSFLLSQVESFCDIEFLPFGLHTTPQKLQKSLQERILETQKQVFTYRDAGVECEYDYDAIVLAYGLCSRGTEGIVSPRYPLVIPRAHDCITLLLGSRQVYQYYIENYRGIYWYSTGWIEHSLQPGKERRELIYQTYLEKYGTENTEYLMQLENNWQKEYSWAIYVGWGFPVDKRYQRFTEECAHYLGWHYHSVSGDPRLLGDLLSGNWDEERFVILAPGERLEASGNEDVFCGKCQGSF